MCDTITIYVNQIHPDKICGKVNKNDMEIFEDCANKTEIIIPSHIALGKIIKKVVIMLQESRINDVTSVNELHIEEMVSMCVYLKMKDMTTLITNIVEKFDINILMGIDCALHNSFGKNNIWISRNKLNYKNWKQMDIATFAKFLDIYVAGEGEGYADMLFAYNDYLKQNLECDFIDVTKTIYDNIFCVLSHQNRDFMVAFYTRVPKFVQDIYYDTVNRLRMINITDMQINNRKSNVHMVHPNKLIRLTIQKKSDEVEFGEYDDVVFLTVNVKNYEIPNFAQIIDNDNKKVITLSAVVHDDFYRVYVPEIYFNHLYELKIIHKF